MNQLTVTYTDNTPFFAKAVLCPQGDVPTMPSKVFTGKYLETSFTYSPSPTLYIGLGKPEELEGMAYKEIGATITKHFNSEKINEFAVELGSCVLNDCLLANLTQGLALGGYNFTLKSAPEARDALHIHLVGEAALATEHQKVVDEALVLAEGVAFARTITNLPANHLRPSDLKDKILQLVAPVGVECEVFADTELAEMGLGGLYGIGSSSKFAPQLVVLRYKNSNAPVTALVGKGITFDTGGSNLKTEHYMETMQGDMGGAAAVIGAIYALAKNKKNANVVGVLPLAENRLSSSSLVPGDVYTAYNGETVEILNTDAEGRIVLADAAAYAIDREAAETVVDIATLTGAAVRTFGNGVTATLASDCKLWKNLKKAAEATGERYARLPIYPEYEKMLESHVADIKNIGGVAGGTITGGLFVKHFVGEKPWLHLDIAGTSWVEKPLFAHQTPGATGTGVDTLYHFAQTE